MKQIPMPLSRHWIRRLPLLVVGLALCAFSGCNSQGNAAPNQIVISTGKTDLQVGESLALNAVVRDASGQALSGVPLNWLSSNPLVLQVQNGNVTALATGNASVRAQSGNLSSNSLGFVVSQSGTGLRAFPGAEGFGANASGGRGGRVIYVTNLNTSGPGSLQAALDESGPRTIVFAVSGVINGPVQLTNGNVTVAGQTSPGGITVRGFMVQGDIICEEDSNACVPNRAPENFIVRFVRSRDPDPMVDPQSIAGGDAFRLHRAKNGILDRVSAGNAYDEAFQVSLSSDITIQNSLLAETLGGHADLGGMLMNYSDPTRGFPLTRISLHHNAWHRINARLPELSRENFPSSKASVMDIEISHNLFFDPAAPMWLSLSCDPGSDNPLACPIDYRMNLVGNLFYARSPRFNHGLISLEAGLHPSQGYLPPTSPTRLHFAGNRINLFAGLSDYQLIYCCNDFSQAVADMGMPYPDPNRPPSFASPRHNFPAISPTNDLLAYTLQNVGVFPRDPMDSRLMGYLQNRSFGPDPTNVNPANDGLRPLPNPAPAPADSDLDGMPDAWENQKGLNPNQPSHNGLQLSSNPNNGIVGCSAGYTNLECYLNELAIRRLAGN